MKSKIVEGVIDNAYGNKLATQLKYRVEVEIFETVEEVRAKGEWPNDKTIVSMVNQRVIAAKRQEAIKAQLDNAGIKPPTLEDPNEAVRATAKILIAQKKASTQEQAEALARTLLGLDEETEEATV